MNGFLAFIITVAIFSGVFFAIYCAIEGIPECLKPPPPRTPQDEAVDIIAMLISTRPEEWKRDHHNWTHQKMKFSLWIANQEYELGLSTSGETAWPNGSSQKNNVLLTKRQQAKLWKVIRAVQTSDKQENERKMAEEALERVVAHLGGNPNA